jgi:MFS family permease
MARATVGELIDQLPVGRFHILHLLRQITFSALFAVTIEATPYIFPGLAAEFDLTAEQEAMFASSFTFGGMLGAALGAIQDVFGRRPVIQWGALFATLMTFLSFATQSYTMICVVRFFLGLAFFSLQYGVSAWYTELLPIRNRGPLYVSLTAGYPIGRLAVILIAQRMEASQWRNWTAIKGSLLALVWLISLGIEESPRFDGIRGEEEEARRQLRKIYSFNGTPFPDDASEMEGAKEDSAGAAEDSQKASSAMESTPLVAKSPADDASAPSDSKKKRPSGPLGMLIDAAQRVTARWTTLCSSPPRHLGFAVVLFASVSVQQCLITNFGPRVFQVLIQPTTNSPAGYVHTDKLDFNTLIIFNCSDWIGILASVLLIDRLGRRGFLTVGFTLAAVFWLMLGLAKPVANMGVTDTNPTMSVLLIVIGSFASATRGFSPEASNLWVLETFPTDQRATCYAAANVVFQLASTIAMPAAGALVHLVHYSPTPLLLGYAGIQLLIGVFCAWLPHETVGKAMRDVSSSGPGKVGEETQDQKK